jgi:hypothetical protein
MLNLDILGIKNKGPIRRRVRKQPAVTPEYTNIAEVEEKEPEFAEYDGEFIEERVKVVAPPLFDLWSVVCVLHKPPGV